VLAIGATGFIGQHIVRLLVGQGHDVGVLHRQEKTASVPEGARVIRGDRNRLDDSRVELEEFGPEVVLDVILYTEEQASEMVKTFRGKVERVVAVSSADVYRNYDGLRGKATAPPDIAPLAEEAPLRETRYPYRGQGSDFAYAHDYEKILVEQVVLSEPHLAATVLRLPAVYGPGDRQHRLQPYLRQMADGRSAIVLEERQAGWRWTRGFVENVAAAMALAVTDRRSANRVYNLGDEPTLTEREWVGRIGVAAGWRGEVAVGPATEWRDELHPPPDWRYDLWTDTTRMRRELGYVQPVPLGEALRRTVEWERSK
jgi:nucleoside-diphosphate-sugar epimerase